jgi:hypothetical protein
MSTNSVLQFSNRLSPFDDIQINSFNSKKNIVQNDGAINSEAPKEEQIIGKTLYSTVRTVAEFFWSKFKTCGIDNEGNLPPFMIECPKGVTSFSFSLDHHHEVFKFANRDAIQPEVVAHEYMHGVVSWLNPLRHDGQQGALNESLADVFAIAFKHLCFAKSDWNVGDYRDLSQSVCLERDIQGINVKGGETYTQDNDYGHVHANSRILSHAFYIVRQSMKKFDPNYNILLGIWWKAFSELKDKSFDGFVKKTVQVAYATQGTPWGDAVSSSWKTIGFKLS